MFLPVKKYKPLNPLELPDREWPSKTIQHPPRWCSVDLRDGNQALASPMNVQQKLEFFQLLVEMGFKEIEVGFPAANDPEFVFVRSLIDNDMIPDDVAIQVITQSRPDLIGRTFESIRGARKVIVNFYVPTSPVQRETVFGKTKADIVGMAMSAAEQIRREAERMEGSDVIYLFAPESFSQTEPEFALEICHAVMDILEPTIERKAIVNLPASVEVSSPNVYADQIEWFCRNVSFRKSLIIGAHVHNDRGTGVAATELALLAGAERVEGTLFGIGERAGNADILTLALNMYTQGIDPGLRLNDLSRVTSVFGRCTGCTINERHPYAGEKVFSTFAGSHQDALEKGLRTCRRDGGDGWKVPYLPIDPADIGRASETLIRINSYSGTTGVQFVIEQASGRVLDREEIGRAHV